MTIRLTSGRAVLALALALAYMAGNPAAPAAADREHQQIMADLRMLQEQSQQLQMLLNTLGDAIKAVNSRLDDQTSLERKAFADGKVQMDSVAGDIRIVREKIDETNVRLSSLSQELESLRSTIPEPVQTPPMTTDAPAPLPDGSVPPPTVPVAAAPVATPPPAGISPQRLFDSARADYSAGDYTLAITGFENYLRYFPKYNNAPDAQMLIGESYRLAGKNAEALTAFDRLIATYPGSPVLAQGYYKRGSALENLKQIEEAKQSYELVVKQFPNTPEASLANQRLIALSRPAR